MKLDPYHVPAHFYTSTLRPCPYLPGQAERKLFTELLGPESDHIYSGLSRAGFRRSHGIAYLPACPECEACKAARINVNEFSPSKSQRRILNANRTIKMNEAHAVATPEQFGLFSVYVRSRHGDGDMAAMGTQDFKHLIEETNVDTRVFEFREPDGQLIGACLVDVLTDGISAVYSFFDPELSKRSLGSYMILSLVTTAKEMGLPYIYLGFWIADCQKMSYKERFKPLEVYDNGNWITYTGPEQDR